MARFKLRFQLMCVWALCLMSLIECRDQGKCLVVTDGEPDDMHSMILMAKSQDQQKICAHGIVINLVWPTSEKRKFIQLIFDTAGIKVSILHGSNSPKNDIREPFSEDTVPESHEILKKELMNSNINFYILILAPSRDLSMVLCDMKDNHRAEFSNIRAIYWSGGWDSTNYEADFNLHIGSKHTLKFMNLTSLEEKIHISSSHGSIYKGSMNGTSFPKLVDFLTIHKETNALFKGLIERQEEWDKFILHLLNEMGIHTLNDVLGKGIQFCPADILATMLMFHPDLREKEEYKYYTVKVTDLGPDSKLPPSWKPMIVTEITNGGEEAMRTQRALIEKHNKFYDYEIVYKHQLYTKIVDHPKQEDSAFKQKVISLLEQYVPQAQQSPLTKTP